jgi:ubiquinone biosynthesis protein
MNSDLTLFLGQIWSRPSAANGNGIDPALVYEQMDNLLSRARSQGNLDDLVRQMVDFVGVNQLLPPCYARYQPMVTESMVFLLLQLPPERLSRKITDQFLLDLKALPGRRVCTLIQDMPSLQKLGQIICRTPGLSPEFKKAMVDLEDNVGTVTLQELLPAAETAIEALNVSSIVTLDEQILAEASVCAVVAATILAKGKKHAAKAVFKILKPQVHQNLTHELKMLNELALFLDHNKVRWGLGDFKFKDTLQQVQWLLENEVNLTQEQNNLKSAGRYFRQNSRLSIPLLLPGSTPAMTVMSRVEGRKVTDVGGLNERQKRLLAETLTEICILGPIKDPGDQNLFHGDPHAGNIAYTIEGGKPRIILYDWGMMGRLSRLERYAFALIGLGVMAKSTPLVLFGTDIVAGGNLLKTGLLRSDLRNTVKQILDRRQSVFGDVLSDIGTLFGELAFQGILFPTNLLMFQKALVTLKGVLADIDPAFNYDEQWIGIALGSYLGDLCRPRYYFRVYREIWALRRYGIGRIFRLHRLIIGLLWRLSCIGLPRPEAPLAMA